MPELAGTVVRKSRAISEADFHAALIAGLARVAAGIGRGNLADKWGRSPRQLGKLFAGDSLDTSGRALLDFLMADPTALDEVLALYGVGLHPLPDPGAAGGADMLPSVIDFAQAISASQRDGKTDHRSRMRLADAARPVAQAACGLIHEADRLRGVA
jgi:hypothetical protein